MFFREKHLLSHKKEKDHKYDLDEKLLKRYFDFVFISRPEER